jgi:hypothetical protein
MPVSYVHPLSKQPTPAYRRYLYNGHATLRGLRPPQLYPYRKAVHKVLLRHLFKKDFNTRLMFTELKAMLEACPFVRQGSTRGLKAKRRAQAILANLVRQFGRSVLWRGKPRPRRLQAPFQILVRALSVECFDQWPEGSTTTYKRSQVARQVYVMMKANYLTIFGKRKRFKIAMQGQAVQRYLYDLVEKCYAHWLKDHREEIVAEVRQTCAAR